MVSKTFRKFIDSYKSGFGIVELPTSIGKTHATFDCIAKYASDWAEYRKTHTRNGNFRQIIVVTPLKKNLQNSNSESSELDGLEKAYARHGRLSEYAEEVLFLYSITEILRKNLSLIGNPGNHIPGYIQQLPSFETLQKKTRHFDSYEHLKNDTELYQKIIEDINKSYFEFRRSIIPAYKQEKNIKDNLTLTNIADNEGYDWLFLLFPDLLIPRVKVLLMSFKKLLEGSVYEKPSCKFLSDQFLKNKIIFIDEFDSTKKTIKDSLAEAHSRDHVDFLQLFASIYTGSKSNWLSDSFKNIDSTFDDQHNLKMMVQIADRRRTDYMLDHAYQTSSEMKDGTQPFIFIDNATRTISKTSPGLQIIVRETGVNEATLMMCRPEEKKDEDVYLDGTIRWVSGFLKRFAGYSLRMAQGYERQENEKKKGTPEQLLSIEDAFRSFLYQYGISRDEQSPNVQTRLLSSMSDAVSISQKSKKGANRQGYDFYLDGFTYYSLKDGTHHNDNTIISMVDIPLSAESILAKMCNNALVLGLSATAGIPSTTGNYNLPWAEDVINNYIDIVDQYPELAEDVDQFLKQRHLPYTEGRVNVCTHVIDNGEQAPKDEFLYSQDRNTPPPALSMFSPKTALRIENYIKGSLQFVKNDERNYCVLRYYNLMKVIRDFAPKKNSQSILFMGTKMAEGDAGASEPSGQYKFDKWIIKKIIDAVNYELNLSDDEKISCDYLYSKDFDSSKERIKYRLSDKDREGKEKRPERLVIISTYQSISTGQNLQYPAPSKYKNHCVRLCPRGGQKEDSYLDKDIDSIYLADITNLVANYVKGKLTEKDLILSIIQSEELNSAYEITPEQKEESIITAFNHLESTYPKRNILRGCESILSERTRTVIQGVGRIGRSNLRCEEINIYIDSSVLYGLHLPTLLRRFRTPEMDAIIQEYKNVHNVSTSEDMERVLRKAATISDRTAEYINRRISSAEHEQEWEPSLMEWWQEMRELVLKYPTASEEEYNSIDFIKANYIDQGGVPTNNYLFSANNRYYQHQRIWFGDRDTFRNAGDSYRPYPTSKDDPSPYICTMNEDNTRLQTILSYPGLRSWWKEQGYADSFRANKYLLSPFLYTEIYKGALGETAGRFILEKETGLSLENITASGKFEKADYVIRERPTEYVDFKHYNTATLKDGATEFDKILKKLTAIGGTKMYVINLVKGGAPGMIEKSQTYCEGKIVVIPWMIDMNATVNQDIKKELLING